MNPLVRAFRATRACYRRQIDYRRDLWIFGVWLVLIVLFGDDLALWTIDKISTDARVSVAAWGTGWLTLAFGVLPAFALIVTMFQRDWRDCWKQTEQRDF